jgi:hypothetical protein
MMMMMIKTIKSRINNNKSLKIEQYMLGWVL